MPRATFASIFLISHIFLFFHSPKGSWKKLQNLRNSGNISHIGISKSIFVTSSANGVNVAIQWFQILWIKSWYKWNKVYLILLCLESLVLKHLRLPYPCCFIWQEKFWRHSLPYIGSSQVSIFRSGFLVTKFWSYLICLGKQRKMWTQKQPSKIKEYAMQTW